MTNEALAPATIELLRRIYEAKDSKLLKTEIDFDDQKMIQRLDQLLAQDLISATDAEVISGEHYFGLAYTSFVITVKGEDLLQRLDQEAQEKAAAERKEEEQRRLEERRYRRDARRTWWQLIITAIISILSLFIGAYLSHHTSWLDWFTGLFR